MRRWVETLNTRTESLYAAIRADSKNCELIAAVEDQSSGALHPNFSGSGTTLVMVPGIFYKDYPHTGADGAALKKIAAALDLPVVVIPLDGTKGREAAIATIVEWLGTRIESAGPIVLVSLSIGTTEVAATLAKGEHQSAFDRVVAWISVSGLPFGTRTLEYALRNPVRGVFLRALCKLKGWDLALIRDLLLHRPTLQFTVPPQMMFIQAVAFPLREHLKDRRSRRFQEQLALYGPSDGFVLLEEIARLPGLIYPLWGADHYLQGRDDLELRIAKLVGYVMRHTAASLPRIPSAT
jgi:hypothetical protein